MLVGIVGCGGMGNVHASKYTQLRGVGLAAYDADPERLAAFCTRHKATPTQSFEELLKGAQAVDVCLPTDLHVQTARQALEAGKPTLLEKPMAPSVAECRELGRLAREKGVALMPAQVVRWFPEHRAAHKAIVAGQIGKPASLRLHRGGKAPSGAGGWFQDYARSGGVLLDLAVHDFDWLNWTLGKPTTVYAQSVRFGKTVTEDFVGDYALTTIRYENGAVAHVESTWLDPSGFSTAIDAAGSEGLIEYDSRRNPSLRLHQESGSRAENNYSAADDPYYRQISAFVETVRQGGTLPVTPEEGANAVAVALAAIESARTGRPVTPDWTETPPFQVGAAG
ncbi:MAG: Gfo/Idh/MocA family oxidoreductase [Fimbriimonadaceae bacterium]|nr:Gfo/Idh/MocA family oxidoreductase [Fimbriimonadaceae bacterium]QYK55318.1 MAG: Gfo/Idh/MocA family oxidoreductase [Fimbriimonadaceae bacterium]